LILDHWDLCFSDLPGSLGMIIGSKIIESGSLSDSFVDLVNIFLLIMFFDEFLFVDSFLILFGLMFFLEVFLG